MRHLDLLCGREEQVFNNSRKVLQMGISTSGMVVDIPML